MRSLVATALVLGMVTAGSPALAQGAAPPAHHHQGNITGLSVWGILAYGGGFGVGARFAIPVGSSGIFRNNPQLSDQFAVELGADVIFWNYGYLGYGVATDIIPTAGFMWVFWLMHGKLGIYPKIDLGWHIYTSPGVNYGYTGLYIQGVGGIIYRTGAISLRGEVGSGMLKLGVALNF